MNGLERWLVKHHKCSERCSEPGASLKEHNAYARATLAAYGDVELAPHIRAAVERGQIRTIEQLSASKPPAARGITPQSYSPAAIP